MGSQKAAPPRPQQWLGAQGNVSIVDRTSSVAKPLSQQSQAAVPLRAELIGNTCAAAGITGCGSSPVLALCRALIATSHEPSHALHVYRGEVLALSVRSISEGVQLTVREDRAGPRFVAWEPFPRGVKPWMRQTARRLRGRPRINLINPAGDPAQLIVEPHEQERRQPHWSKHERATPRSALPLVFRNGGLEKPHR